MKPPPDGWPRISPSIFYDDAAAAIDWLEKAFGFETRLRVEGEGGVIVHSQLGFGDDGLVMVGQAGLTPDRPEYRSPRSVDGSNTQALCIFVDDLDAHCAQAREAGAAITSEPTTQDYGPDHWIERTYCARDPEGHTWWFLQRLER